MHMKLPKRIRFWVLGLNFFHNFYSIYDADNLRVGFAVSFRSNLTDSIVDHYGNASKTLKLD